MIILFDLDGTLIDSTEAILEGFEVAFREFNRTPPKDEEIKRLIGYPLDIMLQKLGVDRANIESFVNAYKLHYREIYIKKTTLLPYAKEAIEVASSIATLGVVTTKTATYSQELLQHMKIMDNFDLLIGRENVKNPKPHPEPILKAMKRLKAKKEETWMIGDTILDMVAAKSAGVKSIGVTCGYGSKSELQKYTKKIVDNSFEAVNIIKIFT